MASSPIPHFTPTSFFYLLILIIPTLSVDITHLLSPYPNLSDFSTLLSTTSVAAELSHRASLTLLAVPNSILHSASSLNTLQSSTTTTLADILRYHVLLQYLSFQDLHRFPTSGKLITTLFQTTGRATNNLGSLNISTSSNTIQIHSPSSNATVVSLITSLPYNITILTIDSLLIPSNFDLMASETRPPLGLNITKALTDGHNFNVAASMLSASGVVQEFEADEGGAGLTLFVPTDEAFADLPPTASFQSLPADKKAVVLRFHVLHSYYPLGSLESIVNPVQPTLATEDMGAGSFTLNISRVNGSVAINTGIVEGTVTQTVFDQNPVAIFGVSRVLLPKEIFGKNPVVINTGGNAMSAQGGTPPPFSAPSPGFDGPASHLSSPPGFRQDATAWAAVLGVRKFEFALLCIGLYLLV